ncbi:LicD family protein [Megamonas funiformis]|uniref:LicD family protein n=2 Tax=Megamonas funiformis TaxID=437897 RepID=UPI001CD39279|nr:LicD family protein [Megamonas funiformis]UBS48145.1 LicD family protein [Megamonas funiformis]GLU98391.1 phosphorylcholine transferase LicD [Megamonas funiformis]
MKKISLEKIKKIELDILINFDNFCKENDLKYYLSGGTLLGAIRHKGFIPWDDDIDVCMPRKDYEKLIKIFPDKLKNKYVLKSIERRNFMSPFAKIIDIRTIIDLKYVENKFENSLWIDIFPVDGLPSNKNEVKKIYMKVNFYRKLLILNSSKFKIRKGMLLRQIFKVFVILIAKLINAKAIVKKIESIALSNKYDKSEYVGAVTWGLYGIGERMKKSEFEKVIYVDFEGYKFPVFSCWDSYLRGLYNDYMKLPPIEKRKTHDMKAYYIGDDDA